MSKVMLIGASHPEETRVALVDNGRVEDFDFETKGSEQLRGNIYLAKVTRVEPSLQACFVDYGGNRHGFLAFSEIHPDYYQLPQEDRKKLLEEAAREAEESSDEDPDEDDAELEVEEAGPDDDDDDESASESDLETDDDSQDETEDDDDDSESGEDGSTGKRAQASKRRKPRKTRSANFSRRYKIQEVIRRRQVLLVQVVKEERGNKGAALTTYLSLAGRYSVLMPNTPRGGGISRKIPNGADRKRLKSVMDELSVPKGMGLIVRTAGAKRTKSEIRRDYEYLLNLWNKIRSKTLESVAPTLIHQEGGLVHRAMRDMFDREINNVVVQGDEAYREAKDLAKVLMPTQARKVQRWTAPVPLFSAEGVEEQLESIFKPVVQMKSGGYLVINQTEALVAIDVNSGKSTRERSIEQTALRTNLEAAEEACRQMRLRDLAGLIVIDFIDMDENKNNRAVEKKMKECLKLDRARVQNSRISQFGLMEISRQRRRAGVMQSTTDRCEACDGTGRRRSIPSAALQVLRAIEARAAGGGLKSITVTAPTEVALYLLNTKREAITAIEEEAGFDIAFNHSTELVPGDFKVESEKAGGRKRKKKYNREDYLAGDEDDHLLPEDDDDDSEDDEETTSETDEQPAKSESKDEDGGSRRKRRRRGRRGGRRRRRAESAGAPTDGGALLDGLAASVSELLADTPDPLPDARLGGLDSAPIAVPMPSETTDDDSSDKGDAATDTSEASGDAGVSDQKQDKPRRRRRRRKPKTADGNSGAEAASPQDNQAPDKLTKQDDSEAENQGTSEPAPAATDTATDTPPSAEDGTSERAPETASEPTGPEPAAEEKTPATAMVYDSDAPVATEPVLETEEPPKKKRRGWWSRG